MATWVWIVIAIVVVAVLAVIAATVVRRRRRTAALQQRFGPEYDRTVQARDDRRAAEADLREREKQRAGLDIRPLPEDMRVRFAHEWRGVQERFVDQPADAVVAADRLVYQVMEARGYPMAEFGSRADLVSVDHPEVAADYRFAHGIRERSEAGQATTEDLREALLRYRSLFSELLREGQADTVAPAQPSPAPAGAGPAGAGPESAVGKVMADGGGPAGRYDSAAAGRTAGAPSDGAVPSNGAVPSDGDAGGRTASERPPE